MSGICLTTLYRLSSIAEADATDQLGIIFVTVDPERDTAAYLADYISNFVNITALTGTPQRLGNDHYRRVVQKVDLTMDYTVDHTAPVFMFDRGEFSGIIAWGEADVTIEEKSKDC